MLTGSVVFAVGSDEAGPKGIHDPGTGQGQEVQIEQQTQNQGEEQQVREEQQTEQQTQAQEGETFVSEALQKRAQTMNELKEMVQQKRQEMTQELQQLGKVEQQVYQNQNQSREAVHALLGMEDLAKGIGPQMSQIAEEFKNSIDTTILAEEKIQKRGAFAKFFMGGDIEAAGELKEELTQNQERIQKLILLKEDSDCDEEVKEMIQEQVEKMELEQKRLERLEEGERGNRGLFGWFKSLFNLGN